MKYLKLLLLLLVLLPFAKLNAQTFNNENSGFTYDINYVASGNVENIIDTMYNVVLKLHLIDISKISKMMYVIKDVDNQNTIKSNTISINNVDSLPENLDIQGDEITLIIGEYTLTRKLKITLLLQDIYGNISEPKEALLPKN